MGRDLGDCMIKMCLLVGVRQRTHGHDGTEQATRYSLDLILYLLLC